MTKKTGSASFRILLVDDHPVFRHGLRRLLEAEPDLEIVGEAGDGSAAVECARATAPDLVLLDVSMQGTGGVEVVQQLSKTAPGSPVLLLTAGIGPHDLQEALRQGARGVVLKTSGPATVLKAIRAVLAGECWVSREMVNDLARALARSDAAPAEGGSRLTPRERAVAGLLAEGLTNKAIAARLSISGDTVKHHLTSAFEKTGVSTRVELALYAAKQGA